MGKSISKDAEDVQKLYQNSNFIKIFGTSGLKLEVFQILENRFFGEDAANVLEYFVQKAEEKVSQRKNIFVTKDDKSHLILKIESSKSDTIKSTCVFWIGQLAETANW